MALAGKGHHRKGSLLATGIRYQQPVIEEVRSQECLQVHTSSLLRLLVLYPHGILITSSHKIKLWEESATDKAIGMQRGYEQRGAWSTATRGGGWVAKDDCLCRVQDEKTTLEAERPNLNSEWRKALPTLPARGNVTE